MATTSPTATNTCKIPGNPDLYGLGIRLSFYLQLIAYLCTMYHIIRNDISSHRPVIKFMSQLRAAFIAYALSVFIILVRETARRTLYAVEVNVVIYLFVPYLSMVTIDRRWRRDNAAGYRFALGLFLGFGGYILWFLFTGMDGLKRRECGEDYAFFFARVGLFGWFRTLLKVMTLPCVVYYGAKFVYLLYHGRGAFDEFMDDMWAFGMRMDRGQYVFITVAVVVLSVELSIHWNSITGVYGVAPPGQLVPLGSGIGLLGFFLYYWMNYDG